MAEPAAAPPSPRAPSVREGIEEWIRTIVYGLLWYFCIITFVIEMYQIPSQSMFPTLNGTPEWFKADRVLTIKALDQFHRLRRGDVIVFLAVETSDERHLAGDRKRLVKRLVAFPGEEMEITADRRLLIDGREVTDPPAFRGRRYMPWGRFPADRKVKVPPGHCVVLGDNTEHSNDSRYWGFLPMENIIGRALCVWWPLDRWSSLNPLKVKE